MLLEAIYWGCLGLILGSFTNVLILRHGKKTIMGRSSCPQCAHTLAWYELIPVVSFILQGGKCRACKGGISLQYPAVELLTALLFLAIGLAPIPLLARLIGLCIIVLLVAITVYDLCHTIIPDIWSYSLAILALVYAFTFPLMPQTWYLTLLAGPLVSFPLYLLWLVSSGRWMGFGDVKLALSIGWLLGALNGFVALALAFVSGAVISVFIVLPLPGFLRILNKSGITRFRSAADRYTMKSEVPFGPFLILALCVVWICMLYNFDLVGILADFLSLSSWS